MSLWEFAIEAIKTPPVRPIEPCAPPAQLPCEGKQQNRLLVAAMFSFEVDTLRVFLEQHRGIADVLLVESTQVHNVHEGRAKPLLWNDTLSAEYANDRFIHAEVCSPMPKRAMWDAEKHQNECMSQAVHRRKHEYDAVVVGSVDEILGREALLRLKHCPLPPLPTSSAIGMPLGRLGRRFHTDWHYPRYPFSFSLPTVYPASHNRSFTRSFQPIGSVPIIGGLHATNYCFLPNIVLKELTATEYGHKMPRDKLCARSIEATKSKCYDMLKHRTREGTGPETRIPCALSPLQLPAWTGGVDARETIFWQSVCNRTSAPLRSVHFKARVRLSR